MDEIRVNASEITRAIQDTLTNYTEDVIRGMEKSADKNAKKGAKQLREISPIRATPKGGRYRAGWTKKKVVNAHVVHNKDRYQIAHLLENGWTKRNGERKEGTAHIKPVEQEMVRDYEEDVRKAIRK